VRPVGRYEMRNALTTDYRREGLRETPISQMPFARGASRKSTSKPRKPWRHNGTSQSATQGFAPVRLGLSGPALWVPQVGISLCRTTRKVRDLTDLPP